MNISKARIILTGASSGIGLAILEELHKKECHVIALARNIERIPQYDSHIIPYRCDISKREEIDTLFTHAPTLLGGTPNLFIANAGFAYYERLSQPDWNHIQSIFETNLFSIIYSLELMQSLHKEHPFNFVCIASAMSFLSLPGYALYGSTKAALKGFSDAFRYELAQHQHLQVVYPIATKTNFFATAGGAVVPKPVQSAEIVAKKIIRGVEKDQLHIYPSVLFHFTQKFFPWGLSWYVRQQKFVFNQTFSKK